MPGDPKKISELMKKIRLLSSQRRFQEAESVRDELLAYDPEAIAEAVEAAEIISEARFRSIDPKVVKIFSKLFKSLSPHEQGILYHGLTQTKVQKGEKLFEQGQPNNRLFFIEEGNFQITYKTSQGNEVHVVSVTSGDLAGIESFFKNTVSTMTCTATTPAIVYYITKKQLSLWDETEVLLVDHLRDYCQNYYGEFYQIEKGRE